MATLEEKQEFSLGLEESEEEFVPEGEGGGGQPAATASDFGPVPVAEMPDVPHAHLERLLTGYACAGYGYEPARAGTRGSPYLVAPYWISCGALNEAAKFYELTFKQSIQVYDGEEWVTIAKLRGGDGISFNPYYFPRATGIATTYNCKSIEHVHKFRSVEFMVGRSEGVGAPLPNILVGGESRAFCK